MLVERRSSLFLSRGASELLRHTRAHFPHMQSRLTSPTRSWRAGACELHLDSRWTDGTLTPPWGNRQNTHLIKPEKAVPRALQNIWDKFLYCVTVKIVTSGGIYFRESTIFRENMLMWYDRLPVVVIKTCVILRGNYFIQALKISQ